MQQVVILGAGYDSRPYRLPYPHATQFYEIDQPATSCRKRELLRRHFGSLPSQVVFLEIDFDQQEIGQALADTGFEHSRATFFLWEGVTNYLTAPAVDSTLRWIGSCGAGHELVFTYVDRNVITAPASFEGTGNLGRTLARIGERWTFGLDPPELRAYLYARGLDLLEDLDATSYRGRYLGRAGQGYEFYHVARARTTVLGPAH